MKNFKLERVLDRPRFKQWIFLFIVGLIVIGLMAVSYNLELFRAWSSLPVQFKPTVPVLKVVLGGLGFLLILGSLILFFVRLLREMRINQIQSDFLDHNIDVS